jgi:putative spermidine/putrescine transport system substrate-binding protein
MKNAKLILALIMILIIGIVGCSNQSTTEEKSDVLEQDWEQIVDLARGSKVNFYMWGGSRTINNWVDTFVASELKEKYNIELNRVPMGPDDYLNKLLAEKQVAKEEGSIDLLWINGENFKTARENELLFGPFAEKLPNYNQYLDTEADKNTTDFGYPTEGYEVPYNRAQFVFVYDRAKIEDVPNNYEQLIAWIKNNPGKFTYPAPPDFTGSAFVRHVIYRETGGYKQYYDMEKEEIRQKIQPALEKLAELEPYLWREGDTYPATIAQLDNMFADGEVWMSMGYDPSKATSEIKKGNYPDTARTFVLEEGTISNTNFLAIPFNASHKPAALVAANFLEGFEAQLSKYKPDNWGALPVFSSDKLSAEQQQRVAELDLGQATLAQQELDNHSVPELPADVVPIIEEEWKEKVGQ